MAIKTSTTPFFERMKGVYLSRIHLVGRGHSSSSSSDRGSGGTVMRSQSPCVYDAQATPFI